MLPLPPMPIRMSPAMGPFLVEKFLNPSRREPNRSHTIRQGFGCCQMQRGALPSSRHRNHRVTKSPRKGCRPWNLGTALDVQGRVAETLGGPQRPSRTG